MTTSGRIPLNPNVEVTGIGKLASVKGSAEGESVGSVVGSRMLVILSFNFSDRLD